MKRLEIHISYDCDNDCIFCSEKNRLKRFENYKVDLNEIQKLLENKRANGYNHVNFTGGEPTLYKDFFELIKYAKGLGYKIYIGSNGLFWSDNNNCQKYLPYIDEISLSLHGYDEESHQKQTNNAESFSRIIKAYENINNYINENNSNIYFFTNIVLTNYNKNKIEKIIRLISKFSHVKQVLVSYVAPEGKAYENYIKLAPKYSEIKLKINNWVNLADKNNLIIRFFGIPLCILNDKQVNSNDLNWDERVTFELGEKKDKVMLKEKETKLDRRRQKIAVCKKCQVRDLCGGVFTYYLKNFGESEIGFK